MLVDYRIRELENNDLDNVIAIEKITFLHPWNKDNFIAEMSNNEFSYLSVLELKENDTYKIVGFYDFWITFDSATIAQIAIDPAYQRQGLGSVLLKDIIRRCYKERVVDLTLEVRKSNEKARNLYKKFGFYDVVTKPHYYDDGEDAIYMMCEVIEHGEDLSD